MPTLAKNLNSLNHSNLPMMEVIDMSQEEFEEAVKRYDAQIDNCMAIVEASPTFLQGRIALNCATNLRQKKSMLLEMKAYE